LILAPGIAVSWVLFNILGPASEQADNMFTLGDAREGKKVKADVLNRAKGVTRR